MQQPTENPHHPDAMSEEIFTASLADPRPGEGDRSSRGSRWPTRLIIFLMFALVLGPVLWNWFPREIARWHTAVAAERHAAGDVSGAIAHLDQALVWDADSVEAYQQRGEWHLEAGRYELAVEDFTRVIASEPTGREGYMQRSIALQHLGRRSLAVADWLRLEELAQADPMQQVVAWNGLAYARALAGSDLDLAFEEINRALEVIGGNAAMLDTRGYIHFLRGDYQAARQDLDPAVSSVEIDLAGLAGARSYVNRQQYEQQLQDAQQSVAVIRYHRALVLEKLGAAELAEQDLLRVRQLGYEPGESLF